MLDALLSIIARYVVRATFTVGNLCIEYARPIEPVQTVPKYIDICVRLIRLCETIDPSFLNIQDHGR